MKFTIANVMTTNFFGQSPSHGSCDETNKL